MSSLRTTIFLFFVALLLAVQVVFLAMFFTETQRQEQLHIGQQLAGAKNVFSTQYESRRYYLAAFAETVARDFGLKQVLQEDTRSLMVALNNHRQRVAADIAMAMDVNGAIRAQLLTAPSGAGGYRTVAGPEQERSFRFAAWLRLPENSYLYPLGDQVYQLSLSPLHSGSSIIGWVAFGYRLDDRLAQSFADMTRFEVDFARRDASGWKVFAASRDPGGNRDQAELAAVRDVLENRPGSNTIGTSHDLGSVGDDRLVAVLYRNRSDLLAEIRKHGWQLGLLGALTFCLSLAGAYVIAGRISSPVRALVEQASHVASGNYGQVLSIDASNELAELAREFNTMQQAVLARETLISQYAYQDPLTGLPNRNRLVEQLDAWQQDPAARFGLVTLSIRDFIEIDSSLGRDMADLVVKEVARWLGAVTEVGLLFHLGGGNFAILLRGVGTENADYHLNALARALDREYRYQGISLYLSAQVGMALYPAHDASSEGLLQKAAAAMQYCVQKHLHCKLYDAVISEESIDRLRLTNELKSAIEQNQVSLCYQPKLDLARQCVGSVEALLRWQHPQRGQVPPAQFIPLAEQTGLINGVTRWVIREAAGQYRQWRRQGLDLTIAVNLSARNLRDENFFESVMHIMAAHALGPEAISFEITESAVMDDIPAAIGQLARFEAAGYRLAIDDYGTGYSSLTQLRKLPVRELKIDKSFTGQLLKRREDQLIVRSTIELAHDMGLAVVAEGIEDRATLDWVRQAGCDGAQGYVIGRPQPAAEFAAWLAHSEYAGPAGRGAA